MTYSRSLIWQRSDLLFWCLRRGGYRRFPSIPSWNVGIRSCQRSGALVAFSSAVREEADALKTFLSENLYRHYKVMRMTNKARRIVRELYSAFVHEPRLLPPDYRHDDDYRQARAIADYIAGMTDSFAISTAPNPSLSRRGTVPSLGGVLILIKEGNCS